MGEMCTLRTGKLCRKPSISINALALVNVQNCKTAQSIVSRHAASQRSFQSLRTAEVTTLNSLCMVTHDKSQQGSESYIYTRIELGVSMVKRLKWDPFLSTLKRIKKIPTQRRQLRIMRKIYESSRRNDKNAFMKQKKNPDFSCTRERMSNMDATLLIC